MCLRNHYIKLGGKPPPQEKMTIFYTSSCQTECGDHIVKGIPMMTLSGKPLGK